ncbi:MULTISPECIES: DUF742 domain-containing protein [Nonomuraea]|jgi:hypothetical protein|uniref:DUF742 domain-containing protein n=2 Tax=Nonomuraea TaxID=83681 RepID=A0ABW1BST8_9ACTN|nr:MULTISPECIES: DUF742 domain-containing protein [Nonomuraea]MDA0643488.1 DUF742 domain-containing protein [Nonomuraea ferruginea]TXK38933.1 DUF742 domain-containing protein [Nonomuraea sp. C10]
MRHWTEGFEDEDADESLVRPYTITGGRTAPERDDLALITLVTTVSEAFPEAARGRRRMQPEHRTIFTLCKRPLAVAEVAAALNLPVSVTKILIGDLIESGQVLARPPLSFAQAGGFPDMAILEAVRDGLREL